MKYIIYFFLLLPVVAFSQDYKADVSDQFNNYYIHMRNRDFEKAADYMNPGFFKLIPKEQLVQAMAQVFNTPGMDFEIGEAEITNVGPKTVIGSENYVKLDYKSKLKMRFTDTSSMPDTLTMKAGFEIQFGKGNVAYDAASGFYTIDTKKRVVANSANGKNWTFVVVEEKQRAILETFLPKEMLMD